MTKQIKLSKREKLLLMACIIAGVIFIARSALIKPLNSWQDNINIQTAELIKQSSEYDKIIRRAQHAEKYVQTITAINDNSAGKVTTAEHIQNCAQKTGIKLNSVQPREREDKLLPILLNTEGDAQGQISFINALLSRPSLVIARLILDKNDSTGTICSSISLREIDL